MLSVTTISRHRLLALLLAHWEAKHGMSVSIALHIRLQQLWRVLPEEQPWEALRNDLCPIFAQNAKQQKEFLELFDQLIWQLELPAENQAVETESQYDQTSSKQGDKKDVGSASTEGNKSLDTSQPIQPPSTHYIIDLDNLDRYDQPPFTWNIVPDRQEAAPKIDMGDDFDRTLVQLRRRELIGSTTLDVPASIKASVRQAGFPALRYQKRTRPPEYLLLVERYAHNDHRSGLFDLFYRTLRTNTVFIERFFYNGDPRICRNERYPTGLTPAELQQRYPNARLMLFGNGYRLISNLTGQLAPWTTMLMAWPVRVMLTPVPRAEWGYNEQVLQKIFNLLTASVQSLLYVAEQPESRVMQAETWPDYIGRMAAQQPLRIEAPLILSLRRHFDADMVCWIAACAVCPVLHYNLTLRLGKVLTKSLGRNLLTADNLLTLSNLPWFIEGRIPPHFQDELRGYLAQRYPQQHRLVLDELKLLLEDPANLPPENSAAWLEHQINLAFIRMETATIPDPKDVELIHAVVKRAGSDSVGSKYLAPRRWEEILNKINASKYLIKLKMQCELLNAQKILPFTKQDSGAVLPPAPKDLEVFPLIKVYRAVFNLLDTNEEVYYHEVLSLMNELEWQIEAVERYDVFQYLRNFASGKIIGGEKNWIEKSHHLNKKSFEGEVNAKNITIQPTTFANVVNIACAVRDFDWASEFVAKHGPLVPNLVRSESILMANAIIAYEQKDYEEVIALLNQRYFKDFFHEIRAKVLLLRSFYEIITQENDLIFLQYLCTNFINYLNRHKRKHDTNIIEPAKSFIKIFKMLILRKKTQKNLLDALNNCHRIYSREWLLEKVRHYTPVK